MNEKLDTSSKKELVSVKHTTDILSLVEKKMIFFQDIIQKTIINVQKNKILDILGVSDVNTCIHTLKILSDKIKGLSDGIDTLTTDNVINNLQTINNELSSLLKTYGTETLDDLLLICFGNNTSIITNEQEYIKYDILKRYFHPTGYKVVNMKKNDKDAEETKKDENKKILNFSDDFVSEKVNNLDCFDISLNVKQFHMKVYGIKLYIYHSSFKKNIMVYGIVDDVILSFMNNKYIENKKKSILDNIPKDQEFHSENFNKYMEALTLKDFLISNANDIYNRYIGHLSHHKLLKQKALSQLVKDFISCDLYSKRNTLIQLLINSENYENKYMAYLLYDILSNDTNGNIDTQEQTILFDSFPWSIKNYFKEAMKKTIQYTNDLSNFDINKIPLEQQICLLKANDNVKEKAMMKLKEIKAKSEDSGSKARQYLDGLLKIPFSIYKKEPIMYLMDNSRKQFLNLLNSQEIRKNLSIETPKEKYTSIEIIKNLKKLKEEPLSNNKNDVVNIDVLLKQLTGGDKNALIVNVEKINELIKKYKLEVEKIKINGKTKQTIKKSITDFVDLSSKKYKNIINELNGAYIQKDSKPEEEVSNQVTTIEKNFKSIQEYISNVKTTLDNAVHGHDKAKKQIERIIGQWINGEQDGYCFGFEGPPGVGKTSLAKRGLSNCLMDENGNSRPFSMIQMGGDSNGSTLHGHNYTYVGSTWGGIVQILIDKKCMNPIIFIDELDKISKTEHGKEIVGILTHLLDPTQNDCFQDKYFSGIDLDLSKALFVLSYNDVESIDKILLDRIHRIKFSNLSLEDKLIICNKHMLPEVYKKMGLEGIINISDDVLKFIIEEYTSEPGVRKLKEILFEIVGEINIDILKNDSLVYDYPIDISIIDIKTKYFKDKHEIKSKKIHKENLVGVINGLWANALGKGGVIPIQAKYFPSNKFLDLKLTGMQGDVMKESMNVALTLAWSLTSEERKSYIKKLYNGEEINKYGIHIHCPEGSVPKDGPSAGTAITSVIYSILNDKKIKHDIAITGEISLDGNVTEIGGLDLKFLGGIKAGVKRFLYPEENKKDYESFMDKYKNSDIVKGIEFFEINNINEVFDLIFE
jgi:ATP-dependent Lon protease